MTANVAKSSFTFIIVIIMVIKIILTNEINISKKRIKIVKKILSVPLSIIL